ncbi:hypothetical protein [Rossellomorea vietnamensis]|uniref:Uncharacterized protein n=1 Tax=Rossellomorea vietnamensis TaxID=218284 RepID=A0A0P6WHS5_9BACI|nr:hypothetical protein [Rossellomorea vietnamensis]KPL61007.1 hypothetical protein AM506_04590 [Rossellomorea vietnamensis]
MRIVKIIFGTIGSVILGLLFMGGGLDLDDIRFQRNIRKLKKEGWFKELSDNGLYYERIFHNEAVREYLLQDNIVVKVKNNEQERNHLISLIKSSV